MERTIETWRRREDPVDEHEHDEDAILCGDCSDDMGVALDEWPDALAELADEDRLRCEKCGA